MNTKCKPRYCLGDLNRSMSIERRSLDVATPGLASPKHTYTNLLTMRAKIETKMGVSEFNKVEVGGERVTHRFITRYVPTQIDVRDRVKDGAGNFYRILQIENVDEQDDWLRFYCIRTGAETQAEAR